MTEDKKIIKPLQGEESAILNKKGWFLLTYYQTKREPVGSNAYNLALKKAASVKRQAGLRILKKGEYTVFEVWEHW